MSTSVTYGAKMCSWNSRVKVGCAFHTFDVALLLDVMLQARKTGIFISWEVKFLQVEEPLK